MKILVTGAGGMLGTDLCRILTEAGHTLIAQAHESLDVRELNQVRNLVRSERPRCVIHAAAFTNVDESERNPDTAYAANTVGSWNVALTCAETDAVMVYVSSCGVFDGRKAAPYTEFDEPRPITHYHRSKYLGEQMVATHCPRHFIVRPGWLYGGSRTHRRNFVEARRREASGKSEIVSAKDKFGSPTYTADFALQVMELMETEAYGTYHVANQGFGSRYEYVSAVVKHLGLACEVRAVGSDYFQRSAPVPAWEALDNRCLRMRGILSMRPWEEALEDYVKNRFLPELD